MHLGLRPLRWIVLNSKSQREGISRRTAVIKPQISKMLAALQIRYHDRASKQIWPKLVTPIIDQQLINLPSNSNPRSNNSIQMHLRLRTMTQCQTKKQVRYQGKEVSRGMIKAGSTYKCLTDPMKEEEILRTIQRHREEKSRIMD